jgi:hypothetical protein
VIYFLLGVGVPKSLLDFSEWNNDSNFNNMFVKLIDELNSYYKNRVAVKNKE